MTSKADRVDAINEAIERGGGIIAFSKAMGVTHQAVTAWRRRGWVPLQRAVAIETIFKIEKERIMDPRIAEALSAGVATADLL